MDTIGSGLLIAFLAIYIWLKWPELKTELNERRRVVKVVNLGRSRVYYGEGMPLFRAHD